MRRPIQAGLPLVLISFAIAAAGCQPEQKAPEPPRIARVMDADPKTYPLVADGSGSIQARITSNIGFLVGGRMATRNVDVGDVVKVGDLIATLDPSDMQNQLDAAKASVTAAQAQLTQAIPQESAKKTLLAQGFTTQAEYDQALQALQSAQANLASAQANERLAQDQLKYTTLNAPVAGAVTQTGAEPGQVVTAGQMVVQVAQTDQLDAVFSVSARVADAATIGIPVGVSLQQDPSIKTTGTVRQIAPNADPVTGTYTVRVGLTDPPVQMRLGTLVNGHAEIPGGLLVRLPPTALLQTGSEPQVWLVGADGTVSRKPVTVSRYDTDAVYISAGIAKGDVVVLAGVNSLAEGQKVTPEKVASP